jgi:RIO-like serine/threonine protein kinase
MLKNVIEFKNDCVVKTVNKPFINITQTWFDMYTELSDNNNYLVKVLDVNSNTIVMESLDIFDDVEECLKNHSSRITKSILCDIILALSTSWAQSIEFSKALPNNDFFVHTDLSLQNIVLTKDNKVKVIDPDSYVIVEKLKYTEKFYMSQINLMANLGIYYNDL